MILLASTFIMAASFMNLVNATVNQAMGGMPQYMSESYSSNGTNIPATFLVILWVVMFINVYISIIAVFIASYIYGAPRRFSEIQSRYASIMVDWALWMIIVLLIGLANGAIGIVLSVLSFLIFWLLIPTFIGSLQSTRHTDQGWLWLTSEVVALLLVIIFIAIVGSIAGSIISHVVSSQMSSVMNSLSSLLR